MGTYDVRSKKVRQKRNRRAARLSKEQNGRCHWCKLPMVLDTGLDEPLRCSLDHLAPFEAKGKKRPAVAAHRICNNTRGHNPAPLPLARVRVINALRSFSDPHLRIVMGMDREEIENLRRT